VRPVVTTAVDVGLLDEPRLDLHQLRNDFETAYRLAFAEPPWCEGEVEVGRFMVRLSLHAAHPGFRCAVARMDGALAGFAYGFTTGEAPWTALGQPPVAPGAGLTDRLLVGAFQLAELAVVPTARGRGIGGRLHDVLLIGLPYDRSWLMTSPGARSALHLYRSRGWETVAELEVPGRLDTRLVMVLDDRRTTHSRPVSGKNAVAPRPSPADRQGQAAPRLVDTGRVPTRPQEQAGQRLGANRGAPERPGGAAADPGRSLPRVEHRQPPRGLGHASQLCQHDPRLGQAGQ
jgi:GNAT superfamily N-acetyltransferase